MVGQRFQSTEAQAENLGSQLFGVINLFLRSTLAIRPVD